MRRAPYSDGAGPASSGFASQSAFTPPPLTTAVADQRSLSAREPSAPGTAVSDFGTLNLPAPALNLLPSSVAKTISNRHMRRLEITTTPIESTRSLFLIVTKRADFQACFYARIRNVASLDTFWAGQLVEVGAVAHNGIRPLLAA
jgi:hypothetical protein